MKATYEDLDNLAPNQPFIKLKECSGPFWLACVNWIMIVCGIEPVFGGWN